MLPPRARRASARRATLRPLPPHADAVHAAQRPAGPAGRGRPLAQRAAELRTDRAAAVDVARPDGGDQRSR
jgi:hypothetical protein